MTIEKSKDPKAFSEFEHAGWAKSIAGYEDTLALVARQTVEATLDAANVGAGARVLDVCTGPGLLALGASQRGAEAVGLDFADEVVDLARTNVPAAQFQRGDAQDLPFDDDSFDAVVCGYGVMHVPEPEIALREMRRVVRPGGRVAISVWDSSTPNNGFGLIYGAIGAGGRLDVPLPHGPDFFQFGSEKKMRAALTEIGFADVHANLIDLTWQVASAAQILHAIRVGAVRARALLEAQEADALINIEAALEASLSDVSNGAGTFDVPLPAIIGSGTKA